MTKDDSYFQFILGTKSEVRHRGYRHYANALTFVVQAVA